MGAIDAITAHYNANRRQFIDVPEWGTDGVPLRIFWQLLTIEQRQKIFSGGNRSDVDTLVAMAQDADGKAMFTLEDKPKLKINADAMIITRIASRMLGLARITDDTVEEAEKN